MRGMSTAYVIYMLLSRLLSRPARPDRGASPRLRLDRRTKVWVMVPVPADPEPRPEPE